MTGLDEPTMHRRAVSVARRYLSGAGRASLLAYRMDPQVEVDVMAHALLGDGRVVVALGPQGADIVGDVVDIRLDVEKFAPDAALLIRSGTLHGLGQLTWLDGRSEDLPGLVGAVAGMPGVRIGVLSLPRLLLHDSAGVTVLHADELLPGGEDCSSLRLDELAATEVVAAVGDSGWLDIISSVLAGRQAGAELGRIELRATCSHTLGSVRCLDVDALGVTVMHIAATHATTVFVPFDAEAGTPDEVRAGLARMLESTVAVDQAGATS